MLYLQVGDRDTKQMLYRYSRACDEFNRDSVSIFDCRKDTKINTFWFTIDKLVVELSHRISEYANLNFRFGFLSQLSSMPIHDIRECARKAVEAYPDDVDSELIEELIPGVSQRNITI
ncbi:hypothetical protein PR048_023365 [Dryococelus australis]|uniref:Uncharacterized protein n=1 Tax=Dryococelus australis TaxID=614101 RepID=A0ABQ9GTV5_9NEOP|nr:hypothetical protein PR048_023365 [Dryococelus australis]